MRVRSLALVLGIFVSTGGSAHALSITVSGTITSDVTSGPIPLNSTGIFGAVGTSLVGDTYTETITTNPLLNANVNSIPAASVLQSYGGPGMGIGGGVAAPFTVTTTVNGMTFSQTEIVPFSNYGYLLYGLTSGIGTSAPMDQVYQGVQSNGCVISSGVCLTTYINAYSYKNPFAIELLLGQKITASVLDPGSNTYFTFRDAQNDFTGFYGSVAGVSVSATPLPDSLPLFAAGLAALGLLGWRRRRVAAV
jgi:hypothetical protein